VNGKLAGTGMVCVGVSKETVVNLVVSEYQASPWL